MLAHLDLTGGRGLEIGPLYTPMVRRSEADVVYADVTDADGLRRYYAAHPGTPVEDIVEVHHPLVVGEQVRSLAEATAGSGPFAWVVASHVAEHVPDLIGWLRDIATILVDGGHLALAIPDRRYSFDARRPATTVGQLLLAHEHGDVQPSVRAVFDHHHDAIDTEPAALWAKGRPPRQARIFNLAAAHDMYRRAMDGEHVDCHVWLFTPRSFVRQMEILIHLGLLDFTVVEVDPTRPDDMEFFVTLRRLERGLDLEGVRRAVSTGFPLPEDLSPPPDPAVPADHVEMLVSPLEVRMLEAKRRAMRRLRGVRGRLPRRR